MELEEQGELNRQRAEQEAQKAANKKLKGPNVLPQNYAN